MRKYGDELFAYAMVLKKEKDFNPEDSDSELEVEDNDGSSEDSGVDLKDSDGYLEYNGSNLEDSDGAQDEDIDINRGAVNSGLSDISRIKPCKAQKGVPPQKNEWRMDHIIAKVYGGTCNGGANSYNNAQLWFQSVNGDK